MNKLTPSIWLLSSLFLAACQNPTLKQPIETTPLTTTNQGIPNWIYGKVSKGAVCSQDRGIYSREKAQNMAINSCLIQLADKTITGQVQTQKRINVSRTGTSETVNTQATTRNDYIVKTANDQNRLKYHLLGKYFDAQQQRAYVWIQLK